MILQIFTLVHVLLSLVGIFNRVCRFVRINQRETARRMDEDLLWTTVATSVTGFLFPFHHFMPSHAVGILSLLILAVAIYARYARHLAGAWRKTYVICAAIGLYLNVFVAIVQAFQKVPALKDLAPTQSEPPFKIAQLVVLVLFILLTTVTAIRFRNEPVHAT